jgi:hypothetical protein
MIENLAFDSKALADRMPALKAAQTVTDSTVSQLNEGLVGIGNLWPGGEDDPLTKPFAATYRVYADNIGQFCGLLAKGAGGQEENLNFAGSAHAAGEQTNVGLSSWHHG